MVLQCPGVQVCSDSYPALSNATNMRQVLIRQGAFFCANKLQPEVIAASMLQ